MKVEKCLANVRCNVAFCDKFAKATIDTGGFKGNLCLCENCLKNLKKEIDLFIAKNKTSGEIKNEANSKKRN